MPVEMPKPVEVARADIPAIELPVRPVIQKDTFPSTAVTKAAPQLVVLPAVKTGAFGDPNGVAPASLPNKGSALAKVGSFDAAATVGSANTAGRARMIASAGFGSIGDGGSGGSPASRGAVHSAGFGDAEPAAGAAAPAHAAAPAVTPVEITFKPKPAYTPEAREKKIEGQVELEVVFSSTGRVQVLRVIHGLGFGLDESARAAALQIRFRPSTRNNEPVDMTGTIHILFELS